MYEICVVISTCKIRQNVAFYDTLPGTNCLSVRKPTPKLLEITCLRAFNS